MKKIAILLPGQLRFRDEIHFNEFLKYIDGHDVYISTNSKFKSLAGKFTKNFIINEIDLPQNNMYQWYHLDNIIKEWKDALLNYDIIIKLRTDLEYNDIDFKDILVEDDIIYSQTDQIFYGKSTHFIKTYEDMYENVINYYSKYSKHSYLPVNYKNLLNSDPNVDIKMKWAILPEIIYGKTLSKIQENIKLNQEILSLEQDEIKNMKMVDGQLLEFTKTTNFTTERCYAIHTLNKGLVYFPQVLGNLMEDRDKYTWGMNNTRDVKFKKIKNIDKGKIVGEKVVDINKIYHYIHGKSKSTDQIINIKYSPTVKYLFGDTEEYINGSKEFSPRIKSFPYLLDLFDKGEWFDILVYEHEDKFIVLDGMHRSSILFYKGYKEVKVKLIEKFPFRNKNFDYIIQKI